MPRTTRKLSALALLAAAAAVPASAQAAHRFGGAKLQEPGRAIPYSHGGTAYPRVFCAAKVFLSPWGFCTGTIKLSIGRRVIGTAPIALRSFDAPSVEVPLVRRGRFIRRKTQVTAVIRTHSPEGVVKTTRGHFFLVPPGRGRAFKSSVASTAAFGLPDLPLPVPLPIIGTPTQGPTTPEYTAQWGNVSAYAARSGGRRMYASQAKGLFGSGRQTIGGDRRYDDPAGITVDGSGNLLVADNGNNRIQRFSSEGRFLGQFGKRGFDPGALFRIQAKNGFLNPIAVATAGSRILISDNRNDRVTAWSGGRFRKRLGRRGSFKGQMVSPWGITVDGSTVYVVDQANYRIEKYSTGGAYRGSFGHWGGKAGGFLTPIGITSDNAGRIYVSDLLRSKIIVFSTAGRFLGEFGTLGTHPGELNVPQGLAFDPKYNLLLLANYGNKRVDRFTTTGVYVDSFGFGSPTSTRPGVLDNPSAVAIDATRRLVYVSDSGNIFASGHCGRFHQPHQDPCRGRRIVQYESP